MLAVNVIIQLSQIIDMLYSKKNSIYLYDTHNMKTRKPKKNYYIYIKEIQFNKTQILEHHVKKLNKKRYFVYFN